MTSILRQTYDHGDREAALSGEILRGLVGSLAHGMDLPGADDQDQMGVFIEPAEHVAGTLPPLDNFISRTQPDGTRSGHGDVDIICYSLRKYLRLALVGNPSILTLLYTRVLFATSELGGELLDLTPQIISRRASRRFLGYLDGQRQRMVGEGKQNRVPSRPELVEAHGFDSKYASHALRLGYQGVELTTTGSLNLPMVPDQRSTLLKMRRGEISFTDSLALIDHVRHILEKLIDDGVGPLPAEPNTEVVNKWCVEAHQRFWQQKEEN